MIRIGLGFTDIFITKFNRRTNEIISNVYDDYDAFIPNWSDSTEKISPSEPKTTVVKPENHKNYPPYFSNKSILFNTVYPNYSYPNYSLYKN